MLMGMRDTKSALSLLQSLYNSQISLLKEGSEMDHETSIAEKLKEDYSENELAKLISTRDSLNELKSFVDKVIFTQAMLYLQIGDTISSRQSFANSDPQQQKTLFLLPSFLEMQCAQLPILIGMKQKNCLISLHL